MRSCRPERQIMEFSLIWECEDATFMAPPLLKTGYLIICVASFSTTGWWYGGISRSSSNQ